MRLAAYQPRKKTRTRRTRPALAAVTAVLLGVTVAAVVLHPADHRAASTRTTKPTMPTVLHLTGQGDATPPAFTTGPDWVVTYTYSCPSGSTFRVVERGGLQNGVALADLAGTGTTATTYVHAVPGAHRLLVETGCTWTLTVMNGDTLPHAGGAA